MSSSKETSFFRRSSRTAQNWMLFLVSFCCYLITVLSTGNGLLRTYTQLAIPTVNLTYATIIEQFPAYNDLTCSMACYKKNWSHLFCFENELCSLYDLKVIPKEDASTGGLAVSVGPVIQCWTGVTPGACLLNGTVYLEGEVYEDMTNCRTMVCKDNEFSHLLHDLDKTCTMPFEIVPDVGCIHYHVEAKTQCDALFYCESFGATLATPLIFKHLRTYMMDSTDMDNGWVGVRYQRWFDGRIVDNNTEFDSGQPNGGFDECATMIGSNDFMLHDKPCDSTYSFVCQKIEGVDQMIPM